MIQHYLTDTKITRKTSQYHFNRKPFVIIHTSLCTNIIFKWCSLFPRTKELVGYIVFIISHFSQNNEGEIQPGYEDLVLSVTDDFHNLGRAPGSSIITLDVSLSIKNEFKCEVLLRNHLYCADTTQIHFQGKCTESFNKIMQNKKNTSWQSWVATSNTPHEICVSHSHHSRPATCNFRLATYDVSSGKCRVERGDPASRYSWLI